MPRSTGEFQTNTNPARSWRSWCSARLPENRPDTDATSAPEIRKPTAEMPNTAAEPTAAAATPPTSGPSSWPTLRPTASVEFAHSSRSSPTRLGTAALDAGMNGASASPTRAARATSSHGACATTIAAAKAAAASSETIITRRRS